MTDATVSQLTVSSAAAARLIDLGVQAATAQGKSMVIAVVDAGGELKAFTRMDGAPLLSVDIAVDKAWTAVAYGIPTHAWREFLDADAGVAQIAHRPRLTAVGGGYPLRVDGVLIGGLGLSGGHYSEDQAVAEATLTASGFSF